MPITPLPQFEADVASLARERRIGALAELGFSREELAGLTDDDLAAFEKKKPPRTLVVRFGAMYLVGEYPYGGEATPGCGSRLVVRTHRGTEIGEMLTSTCPNAGCSKSISRSEMLRYIENSGGRDYPFFTDGRVLRVATARDLDEQAAIEQRKHGLKTEARSIAERMRIDAKIVEVEPILGGERMTIYYASEQRVDHRAIAGEMSKRHRVRVDTRSVGARDEARLTADYEKCGQYCCCKNFLKVLKPVSMRSAKVQKATLDPLKISGRCGRLMCCLRYEDSTYDELRKRLPNRKKRVGTPEGDGFVVDSQILTQLVLVELDKGERAAFPVEEIGAPGERPESAGPARETTPREGTARDQTARKPRDTRRERRQGPASAATGSAADRQDAPAPADAGVPSVRQPTAAEPNAGEPAKTTKKKRRRRRRKPDAADATGPRAGPTEAPTTDPSGSDASATESAGTAAGAASPKAPERPEGPAPAEGGGASGDPPARPTKKKRRRRRRKPRGDESGGGQAGGEGPAGGERPPGGGGGGGE